MLVSIEQHLSFSAQTYFNYKTFHLVQCFSTVFGIRPIFEIHRGMWPGYAFFRFHERFWHLVHFRNAQRHVARLYFFSFSLAFFFAFVGFKLCLAFCPFSKCTGGMCSGHIFFCFHAWPQKSYQSKFQKCCPTK